MLVDFVSIFRVDVTPSNTEALSLIKTLGQGIDALTSDASTIAVLHISLGQLQAITLEDATVTLEYNGSEQAGLYTLQRMQPLALLTGRRGTRHVRRCGLFCCVCNAVCVVAFACVRCCHVVSVATHGFSQMGNSVACAGPWSG